MINNFDFIDNKTSCTCITFKIVNYYFYNLLYDEYDSMTVNMWKETFL